MLFLRGIATLEAAHGPEHPDVAAVLSHFAALLHQEVGTVPAFLLHSRKARGGSCLACMEALSGRRTEVHRSQRAGGSAGAFGRGFFLAVDADVGDDRLRARATPLAASLSAGVAS